MHPVSHFKGIDARGNLGVADRAEVDFVEFLDEIERAALHFVGDAGGIGEEEHRVAGLAEGHAGINGRQKTAPVKGRAAAQPAGGVEHDEARQILRFAAESIEHPRAEAGPAKLSGTGLHQHLPGRMVKCISRHRFHDCDVIHNFGQLRQGFRKLRATLTVLSEFEFGGIQRRIRLDERILLALHNFLRNGFAVVFRQTGFVIEQIELTRRATHE